MSVLSTRLFSCLERQYGGRDVIPFYILFTLTYPVYPGGKFSELPMYEIDMTYSKLSALILTRIGLIRFDKNL